MRLTVLVTSFLAFAALVLSGCGTTTGGGAVATPCTPSGACPGNLICINSFCVVNQGNPFDTASAGTDVAAQPDTTSSPDLPKVVPDVPITVKDTYVAPDVPPADVYTPPADISTKPDLPAAGPMTISEIQSGSASVTCANSSGTTTTFAGVQLEPSVVVGPSFTIGTTTKSQGFFVAPASGSMDGTNAGIQVVVYNGTVAVNPGDVVSITGDVKEFYCMTEIAADAANVQVTGKVAPPIPAQVQVGLLGPNSAEPFEDELIQLSDVYVVSPNTTGTDGKTHGECSIGASSGTAVLFFAPGLSFTQKDAASGQIVTKFTAGQHFTSLTGILTYSFGEWLLKPRTDADIVN